MTTDDLVNMAIELVYPDRVWPGRNEIVERFRKAFDALNIQHISWRVGGASVTPKYPDGELWFHVLPISLNEAEAFLHAFGASLTRDELEARATLIEMSK